MDFLLQDIYSKSSSCVKKIKKNKNLFSLPPFNPTPTPFFLFFYHIRCPKTIILGILYLLTRWSHWQGTVWALLVYNYPTLIYAITINKPSPYPTINRQRETNLNFHLNQREQTPGIHTPQIYLPRKLFMHAYLSGNDKNMLTVLFQYRNTSSEQILAEICLIFSDRDLWEAPGWKAAKAKQKELMGLLKLSMGIEKYFWTCIGT